MRHVSIVAMACGAALLAPCAQAQTVVPAGKSTSFTIPAFETLDRRKAGKLSFAEFQRGFSAESAQFAAMLFQSMDGNKDKVVTRDEFASISGRKIESKPARP